jgi:hypothetical protein
LKKIIIFVFLLFVAIYASCQNNIYNLLNKEIVIHDNWAGQSFTLEKENGNYYIQRRIFGSGVDYIGTIIYKVIFDSEYKISFFEIFTISENIKDRYNKNEIFELYYKDNVEIYVNGMKININYIK